MKTLNWKDIVELVGIVAVVASLIFVGLQLRQEQEIAVSQLYADWDDTRIEWARLLGDNDHLWLRGLSGEPLDDREKLRFEALADAWFHLEHGRWVRARRQSLAQPEMISLRNAYFVYSNQGLLDWWARRRDYRESARINVPTFMHEVDGILEECIAERRDCPAPPSAAPM